MYLGAPEWPEKRNRLSISLFNSDPLGYLAILSGTKQVLINTYVIIVLLFIDQTIMIKSYDDKVFSSK